MGFFWGNTFRGQTHLLCCRIRTMFYPSLRLASSTPLGIMPWGMPPAFSGAATVRETCRSQCQRIPGEPKLHFSTRFCFSCASCGASRGLLHRNSDSPGCTRCFCFNYRTTHVSLVCDENTDKDFTASDDGNLQYVSSLSLFSEIEQIH